MDRCVRACVVVMALAALAIASCILDEHYTGLGDKALPGDPLRPIQPDIVCQGGGGGTLGVADLSGMAWRFDQLALTKPIELLNDAFFTPQIEEGALNIVLVASKDDRAAGTLELRAGAADSVGGAYKMRGEGSVVSCTLAGAAFDTATPSELRVPVDLLAPPELPLRALKLGGTFSADAGAINSGKLEGVLTGTDAAATKLGDASLGEMLVGPLAGVQPDLDLEPAGAPDGVMDSWTVTGTFTAKKIEIAK
jgi:hypothetical protein